MGNEGAAEFWFDHGCWLVDQLHNKPFSHYAERQQLLYSGRKDCIICASCVCVCVMNTVCYKFLSVHARNKEILYMFTVRYLNTPHEEVTWKVRRFLFEQLVYSLFDSRLFCRCWLLKSWTRGSCFTSQKSSRDCEVQPLRCEESQVLSSRVNKMMNHSSRRALPAVQHWDAPTSA